MKTDLTKLAYRILKTILLRGSGLIVGISTIYTFHIVRVLGGPLVYLKDQIASYLMILFSFLLFIPVYLFKKNSVLRYIYIGLGSSYILAVVNFLSYSERDDFATYPRLFMVLILFSIVVLLHLALVWKKDNKSANNRLHSIADTPGDPVEAQAAQSEA